jgi:hypothetical protein
MATNNASFSSWEESWANYLVYGGDPGYTAGLPGMTTKPNTGAVGKCSIHLCKSDPRTSIVYPNYARLLTLNHPTFEPTAAEYQDYQVLTRNRRSIDADGFEAVDLGSGQWVIRNKLDLTFATALAGSTGCTLTHAVWGIVGTTTGEPGASQACYWMFSTELDTPIVIPNGGAAGPVLTAQSVVFEVR